MGLVMQFICLVLIARSLFSQGSAEGISPSPSTLSSPRPIGIIPQPLLKSTPEPTIINSQGPSSPPSIPATLPPAIPAILPPLSSDTPPPETVRLPPLPPLSLPIPVILPPLTSDAPSPPPPPPLSPQSTPSVLPPLTSNAPPPPLTFTVLPPLLSPPTPVLLPPRTSSSPPPPLTSEVPPPSLPPTTPVVLPPLASNSPPPPLTSDVPPPSLPPTTLAVLPPLTSNSPPPPLNFQVPPPLLPPPTPAQLPPLSSNAPPPPPPLAIEAPPPLFPPPTRDVSPPPTSSTPPPPTQDVSPPPISGTPPPPLTIQVPPSSLPPSSLPSTPPPQATDPVLPPPASEPITSPPLPENKSPPPVHIAPPPREPLQKSPPVQPEESPPSTSPPRFSAPPTNSQRKVPSPNLPDPEISPLSAPISSPANSKPKTNSPPAPQESSNASPPRQIPKSPPNRKIHPPESLPSNFFNRHQNATKNITSPAQQGSVNSPAPLYPPKLNPNTKRNHHMPPPLNTDHSVSRSPSQSPESPPISITVSSPRPSKMPLLTPFHSLPPPPPNEDCTSKTCTEPLTNTPPGSPCGCVLPMQVELRLSVALYTFFPLVAELANEIAIGVFMRQSQVRIMGANAASQDPEKTIVLVDLVPLGDKIDNTTAFLIFQRFWNKQVFINPSFFGNYEVLDVRYTGLPSSPPSAPSDANIIGSDPYNGDSNNHVPKKPFGVDVSNKNHRSKVTRGVIAIIILSASFSVILLCAIAWVFFYKNRHRVCQPDQIPPNRIRSFHKLSANPASMIGSGPSSVSLSLESSIAPYTGSAKTYTLTDIERATDNFNDTRIVGEGGFGRVYSGVLDDGTKVAVKVLKRDDQQGGREFLAEVEMLSRLHHRNLVKLIGICTEEHSRSLVYELIPNGSVDSHLHGIDRDKAPLDWVNRMKIALGAARALAYLHEDSSPRVIHRDFKSSNILLEDDFTPKVSDFGLARAAFDEENKHISTRVMGTFGYVAPEYAMTGHLLVKSDVYSYGVVLLELLTGRKPVDMSQPPGQENLVAWARPHLNTKEGLESIIDPSISGRLDFRADTIAKVAAIASMCVQPEVSHRPFMGEVVQALKLVCNEFDENDSDDDVAVGNDVDPRVGLTRSPASAYESPLDVEMGIEFRRHSSSSGNLVISRSLPSWQKLRKFSGDGSVSEHGAFHRLMRSGSQ